MSKADPLCQTWDVCVKYPEYITCNLFDFVSVWRMNGLPSDATQITDSALKSAVAEDSPLLVYQGHTAKMSVKDIPLA